MLGYATIGVNDLAKAKQFYTDLLAGMGAQVVLETERIVFFGTADGGPMLAICIPWDQQAASPGNGTMLALNQSSKENVDKMYQQAIALGASCEGEPGQRVPDVFYGAYVRDPDGNKLAFCIFA